MTSPSPSSARGPYEESDRYRRFMGWDMPWYSVPAESHERLVAGRHFGMKASYLRDGNRVYETYWTTGRAVEPMAPSYGILDMTVYGRQETWEDSPSSWPQPYETLGQQFRKDGRRPRNGHGSPPATTTTSTADSPTRARAAQAAAREPN
ncbi:DUF899 family protein [Nonomuraea polychroma]|uniref:DUF899 family protein n=1 Tax=Nonomuraea polychroma TaxID=46176 RepID=UPI003D8B0B95